MAKKLTTGDVPPALAKSLFPIAKLIDDPRNARKHDERNLQAIADSLQRFGWRSVVIARTSDSMILAGHGRIAAAKTLGWTHAPVAFVEATDEQAAAFSIADNRTAELADWDYDVLARTLAELTIEVPGFDVSEIAALAGLTATEAEPEPELRQRDDAGRAAGRQTITTSTIKVVVPHSMEDEARAALQAVVEQFEGRVL